METDYLQRYKPVKLHFNSCSTAETEDSDRSPIILVHGLFATHTTWNRVKCQISNRTRRKVYSLDIRNHGKSEYTDEFTVKHMVSDLLQFMEDQKIRTAIFVGHSAGGRAVMQLALTKPEVVDMIVVEDICITDAEEESRGTALSALLKSLHRVATQLPSHMREIDAHKMMQRILARHMSQFSVDGASEVVSTQFLFKDQQTGEFKFNCNTESLINVLENIGDLQLDLKNEPVYTGEALFIKGEHSIINSIIEKDADLILHYFPQAEFETVSKGHHASHVECPEEFTRKVGDFIFSQTT